MGIAVMRCAQGSVTVLAQGRKARAVAPVRLPSRRLWSDPPRHCRASPPPALVPPLDFPSEAAPTNPKVSPEGEPIPSRRRNVKRRVPLGADAAAHGSGPPCGARSWQRGSAYRKASHTLKVMASGGAPHAGLVIPRPPCGLRLPSATA
jgi:hypothetical protein